MSPHRRVGIAMLRSALLAALCASCAASAASLPNYGNSELAMVGRVADEQALDCDATTYRVMMVPPCGPFQVRLDGHYFRGYALEVCGEQTTLSLECWGENNAGGREPACVIEGRPRPDAPQGSREAAVLHALGRAQGFPCFCDEGAVIEIEVTRKEPATVSIHGCGPERNYRLNCKPVEKGDWTCAASLDETSSATPERPRDSGP